MPEQAQCDCDDNGDALPTLIHLISPLVGNTLRPGLNQMGESSLFNLETALMAMHRSGVGGQLVIDVPAKVDGRYEVDWVPTRNCHVVK